MKLKNICIIIITFYATIINAQNNNATIAHQEFQKGNYKDAVGLYNGAIAVTSDYKEKEKLKAEKEKSSQCWKHLEDADRYYSQANYKSAIKSYNYVLNLNSKDKYAQRRISLCQNIIAREEQLKRDKERAEHLLKNILASNDIKKLNEFADKNPKYYKSKELKEIVDYYNNPKVVESKNYIERQSLYIKFGNIYYDYNKTVANFFYSKAALSGSLTGFYNLSLVTPQNNQDKIKRLLAFAASNGYNSAIELLKSKYPNTKINKYESQNLYKHLCLANKGNLYSLVYCQKHIEIIGLGNITIIDEESDYDSNESSALYELAKMYKKGKYVNKNINKYFFYLNKAASLGDNKAQFELASTEGQFKYKQELKLCAAINGNEIAQNGLGKYGLSYAKEYVKYLKNKECDWFSVRMFLTYYAKNYNIEDVDASLIAHSCYRFLDRKLNKQVKTILKTKKVWDERTIQKIKDGIYSYGKKKNKYHNRVLKTLSKIKTGRGIRRINDFQKLIEYGYCDNPHSSSEIIVKDFLL